MERGSEKRTNAMCCRLVCATRCKSWVALAHAHMNGVLQYSPALRALTAW